MNIEQLIKEVAKVGHSYKTEKGVFRASSLYQCGRKTLLEKKDAVTRYPDELKKVVTISTDGLGPASIGNGIHAFVQDAVKHSDKEAEIEKLVKIEIGNITIMGHVDIEFKHKIVDIKTVKWVKDDVIQQKLGTHLDQLAVYQIAANKHGELWYIGRGWGRTHVHEQSLMDARRRFLKLLEKAFKLHDYELFKELPVVEEPYSKDHWLCKSYCQFREVCFE